jgi:hypothetical protein
MPALSTSQMPSRQERLDLRLAMAPLAEGWPNAPLVELKPQQAVA